MAWRGGRSLAKGARRGVPASAPASAERTLQCLAVGPALPDHPAVHEDDGHSEVIQIEELRVAIDVAQFRLDAQVAKLGEGFITEMAAMAGDQLDPHVIRA